MNRASTPEQRVDPDKRHSARWTELNWTALLHARQFLRLFVPPFHLSHLAIRGARHSYLNAMLLIQIGHHCPFYYIRLKMIMIWMHSMMNSCEIFITGAMFLCSSFDFLCSSALTALSVLGAKSWMGGTYDSNTVNNGCGGTDPGCRWQPSYLWSKGSHDRDSIPNLSK